MSPRPTPTAAPRANGFLYNRQGTSGVLPACVTPCIEAGDIGTCTSLADDTCLCQSATFFNSVESCMNIYCTDVADLQAGYDYASYFCAQVGITLPATTITSANTLGTGLPTSTVAANATAATSTGASTTSAAAVSPIITTIHDPSKVVDIAMSSICGILLAIAVAIAVWNIRSRAQQDKAEANARWTGAGSTMGNTSFNGSKNDYNKFSRSGHKSQNKSRNLSHLDSSMFTRSAGFTSGNGMSSTNRGRDELDDYDDDLGLDSKYDQEPGGRDTFDEDEKYGLPRLSLNRTPKFGLALQGGVIGQDVTVDTIPELEEGDSAQPSPAADSQFSAGASTTNLGEVTEEESVSRGKRMSGVIPELWTREPLPR